MNGINSVPDEIRSEVEFNVLMVQRRIDLDLGDLLLNSPSGALGSTCQGTREKRRLPSPGVVSTCRAGTQLPVGAHH